MEQALPPARDTRLRAYILACGRLAMLLSLGVPIERGMEATAESVTPSEATDALIAARKGILQGDMLSDALQQAASSLPPLTIDMIRDGEHDGRLGETLAVVADYLLDEEQGGQ